MFSKNIGHNFVQKLLSIHFKVFLCFFLKIEANFNSFEITLVFIVINDRNQ